MKKIERFLLRGCAYTVLILTLCYLLLAITDATDSLLPLGKYFLVLLFGFIISGAEVFYEWLNMKKIVKGVIHYFLLLLCFIIIFVIPATFGISGGGKIFVAIVLYTLLYFLLFIITHFVGKAVRSIDGKMDGKESLKTGKNPTGVKTKSVKASPARQKTEKQSYQPRFKD